MIPVRDHNPLAGPVWVVWLLLLAAVVGFVFPWWSAQEEGLWRAAVAFGLTPAALLAEPLLQAPTLLTHAFLHGSWAHLIGNLVFLWVFGDNVEDRLGHGRFLLFFLLGAAVGGLGHVWITSEPRLPLIGASGAVSAIMGAYIRFFPRRPVQAIVVPLLVPWMVLRVLFGVPAFFLWTLPAWVYLAYWALVQVWEGVAAVGVIGGGVAWWAHVGGFAFGALLAPAFARRRPPGHLAGSIRP